MKSLLSMLRGSAAKPAPMGVSVEAPKGKVTVTVQTKLDAATFQTFFKAGKDTAEFDARMQNLLADPTLDLSEVRKAFKQGFLTGSMRKRGHSGYGPTDAFNALNGGGFDKTAKGKAVLHDDEKASLTAERKAWSRLLEANGLKSDAKNGGENNGKKTAGRPDGSTGGTQAEQPSAVNEGKDGVNGNVEPNPEPTPAKPDAEPTPVVVTWPSKAAAFKGLSTVYAQNVAEAEKAKDYLPSELYDLIARHKRELDQMVAKHRKVKA